MIKRYLKNKLCPESVNRLQVDVDLTDVKAIRRAIHLLHSAIPDEERVFSRDMVQKMLNSNRHKRQINDEPFLTVIIDKIPTEARPQTHPKLFTVFEYLHTHSLGVKDVSLRQLERITGVSKSYCQIALYNWEIGLDVEYAEFKQAQDEEL